MPSYEKEAAVLAGYCRRCGGKCCGGHYILISAGEYALLAKMRKFPEGGINSPTGCVVRSIDALGGGKCPFLEKEGCILPGKMRPLVCRMFPVTFTLEKEGIRFHLSKFCPYAQDVRGLKIWLEETKKEALTELAERWSRKEIRCFGDYLRKKEHDLMEC